MKKNKKKNKQYVDEDHAYWQQRAESCPYDYDQNPLAWLEWMV